MLGGRPVLGGAGARRPGRAVLGGRWRAGGRRGAGRPGRVVVLVAYFVVVAAGVARGEVAGRGRADPGCVRWVAG